MSTAEGGCPRSLEMSTADPREVHGVSGGPRRRGRPMAPGEVNGGSYVVGGGHRRLETYTAEGGGQWCLGKSTTDSTASGEFHVASYGDGGGLRSSVRR